MAGYEFPLWTGCQCGDFFSSSFREKKHVWRYPRDETAYWKDSSCHCQWAGVGAGLVMLKARFEAASRAGVAAGRGKPWQRLERPTAWAIFLRPWASACQCVTATSQCYRVSKHNFLRDCCTKLADLCLDIWPIYFQIIVHKRNWEILLCLLCDLVDNQSREGLKIWLKLSRTYLSISQHRTVKLSGYHLYAYNLISYEILELPEEWEGEIQMKEWIYVTMCTWFQSHQLAWQSVTKVLKLPNFWDLETRLTSDTTIHLLYTEVTLRRANLYIIMLNPKVWLVKDAADVILFVIW